MTRHTHTPCISQNSSKMLKPMEDLKADESRIQLIRNLVGYSENSLNVRRRLCCHQQDQQAMDLFWPFSWRCHGKEKLEMESS